MAIAARERRTVVEHSELALGRWTRAIRAPDPRLRPLVHRDYVGFVQEAALFELVLEAPQPALTLMVCLDDPLRVDGAALPRAWVAGLEDSAELVEMGARQEMLDVKLTPLGAYVLFGLPLHELARTVVALEDVFGAPGRRLEAQLRDAPGWDERFDLLDAFLLRRAANGPRPSPTIVQAWSRLCETAGQLPIGTLAAELGWSRRHLAAQFHEQVGLPPKTVARLLRFQRVRRRIERDPARWVDIAYDCGYADQSHLNRDFRELAGTTPGDFLARHLAYGLVVGDVTFVQDGRRASA